MLKIAEAQLRVDISPTLYGEVVRPGSREHEEIVRFQEERFELVGPPTARSETTFIETTDYAPERTFPVGVYRHDPDGGGRRLIGAARLEMPGATVIESMIELRPDTPAARAFGRLAAAEIGGFATPLDLDKVTLTDVIDAIVATIVELAHRCDIEWLWIFPRVGMISVLRATLPDLLPPYHFSYCADWVGWREESPQYQQFRSLGLRGVSDQPQLFQIQRDEFAADLARRLALRAVRVARAAELEERFRAAMVRAERDINDEIVRRHNETHDFSVRVRDELDVRPGMRVLNMDCGTGKSLAWLRERTGEHGTVVGLERDAALVRHARLLYGGSTRSDLVVMQGGTNGLTFPDGLFGRVYADRALQRTNDARIALSEMRRVLAPGGVLSLVVPLWETLQVHAGRYRSEDDDEVLASLRRLYRREFPTQLDLESLRELMGRNTWESMRVTEAWATFTDINRVRALLWLPEARLMHDGHDVEFVRRLDAFERRMERAERAVSLAARVKVLYAWARRPAICAAETRRLAPGATLVEGRQPSTRRAAPYDNPGNDNSHFVAVNRISNEASSALPDCEHIGEGRL